MLWYDVKSTASRRWVSMWRRTLSTRAAYSPTGKVLRTFSPLRRRIRLGIWSIIFLSLGQVWIWREPECSSLERRGPE